MNTALKKSMDVVFNFTKRYLCYMMDMKQKIAVNFLMENVLNTSTSTESSDISEISWNSSFSVNTSLNSEENDSCILLLPLLKYLINGRKKHRVEHYLHVVDSWTDLEFKEHLRVERTTAIQLIVYNFLYVLDELRESNFIPSHSFGTKPIEAKLSFLIFLWHMANTEPLRTISDRFDVSISSVFRVIRRVTAWILTKLDNVIKWPQEQHIEYVCHQFYTKRGSLHDARVLRKSVLYNSANEHREVIFPNEKFIIGDSAYPSLQWLVPPFRDNGYLTPHQTEFNFIHSSTRMVVEKAFGYLKGRFRRIKFFSEYREMSFITNTVVAACILHNLCLNCNDDNFNDDNVEIEEPNDNINNDTNEDVNCELQVDRRMQVFREIFGQE
ncbi:uncharacterized protein LOC118646750 isoform X3 [Monomorium pharaonis]|uniref:uncharacterized protein LOC118646750 isoform X3 n=1 Tax=Monomorium pharaonis TaxID=307658 RepID=UPI001745D9AA|nr:uncharacterized protein LOC118646750 isoform X3 [Monomorium pharaonis]